MTPNPAPEPGQRVWIEAEAWYPPGWTTPLLCPLDPDGKPKTRDGFGPKAVVWHPADVPPQPPAGEGAALIAATEQEIRDREIVGLSRWETIADAWEATARRLAALLDGQNQPVQATTHGEAGEAQTGAEGADDGARVYRAEPQWVPCRVCGTPRLQGRRCKTCANGSEPAAQGAGRDWRGETLTLAERESAMSADELAEQLAAVRRDRDALDELLDGMRAERNAARRELEQLRGEVGKIADRYDTFASGSPVPETLRSFADTLRAALAATAPATQDGASS